MPKITRQTFKQFAVNVNAASDICEFGTPATGSPIYTNTISTLQANAAWTTGWAAETVANNRPFLEDMNAYCYVLAYMMAYLMEMGIPEYDAGTTYYTNSVVQYSGLFYQSKVDSNVGNTPTIGANWQFMPISGQLGAWTSVNAGTIYQATTDLIFVAVGGSTQSDSFYTDSSSSPSTLRGTYNAVSNGMICCPVRKGDYFQLVVNSGSGASPTYYTIAIGS